MSVQSSSKGFHPWQVLFLAAIVVALAFPATSSASQQPGNAGQIQPPPLSEHTDLLNKANAEGQVRVIAGLALPIDFQAEGLLAAPHAAAQRQTIANTRAALQASLTSYNAQTYAEYSVLPYVALEVDAAALQALVESPLVASLVEDVAVPTTLASSTAMIGLPSVWAAGFDGAGQAVVVLDSGLDTDHPFFGSRVVAGACFSNMNGTGGRISLCPNGAGMQVGVAAAESDAPNPACWNNGSPLCWHGTHVAGIAAGGDDNTFDGVARGASIIPVQVFTRFENYASCGGSGTCILSFFSDQLSALEYVYTTMRWQHPIASVNMSLGGGMYTAACDTDPRKAAIDNLRSVGIATIIAAGNNNWTDALTAPACISTAISVGGVNDSDTPPPDTVVYNMHALVDLLSPARSITSSNVGGGYSTSSGTSMAAPHVAGAVALCKSANPALTVDQIEFILENTGVTIADTRPGGVHSKPRIRLDVAIPACSTANFWTGAANREWNNPANWSRAAVPDAGAFAGLSTLAPGAAAPRISSGTAVVNTLLIGPDVQLDMTGGVLRVSGNLEVLDDGQFNATGGDVVFEGNAPHRVALASGSRFFNLDIGNGAAITLVTVASDLAVAGDLTLLPGATLDLAAHTATVEGSVDNHGALSQTRNAPAAATQFLYLTNATGAVGKYWGVEITPTGDMGPTTVTIQGHTSCSAINPRINRCYDISPTNSQTATIKFYYKEAEQGQVAQPTTWHWNGTAWEALTSCCHGGSGDSMYAVALEVSAYSPFELGEANPLAVTLASFQAVSRPTHVLVTWETVSEANNGGFVLWRSTGPSSPPVQLAAIPSQGPGSTLGFSYSYTDSNAVAGQTHWYWLDAVDLSGATERHGPVSVVHTAPFARR